jgi:ribosomal protein S18 acetylase RimI-like enzyme
MRTDFFLTPATAADAEDYSRIGRLCLSRFNTVTTNPTEIEEEIRGSVTYMIRVQGRSIGFVSYVSCQVNHAYISEVQIEPNFRGKGIGSDVLSGILRKLKEIEIVDLHTHPENPAQRLYRRLGFRETGEVLENYHDTGEPRMRMLLVRE